MALYKFCIIIIIIIINRHPLMQHTSNSRVIFRRNLTALL